MRTMVFATGNVHKIREVRQLLNGIVEVKGLRDIGCYEEIPENSPTIEGNALQKARFIYRKYGLNCFAEDTGLEVEALEGEPGVFSARYAGPERDAEANMNLLLQNLKGRSNRRARFLTVIALILDGTEHTFTGVVNGRIARRKKGSGGFGYDPVFIPEGFEQTFAAMPAEQKNAISHRGRAIRLLREFLEKENRL